ncbi:MAG: hypothetical protein A2V63_04040 [Candidatus Eisenbacteria bacterium RBG_19FT_COMBO_70_11]|nr:MAG: hypothetical protein A2V63_04040 [Candidatus Eisenbacteria bacterium RBG_19FT_COMBO_70_11]
MNQSAPNGFGFTPHIVATGFTTAFLGDERTLREFVAGDLVVRTMLKRGRVSVLYLINDTYDPLDERQLRVGVNKDPALIEKFKPFCGRPISEIPDPYGCHDSYALHFTEALLGRLHSLDIHPVVLDSYQAYQSGLYAPFVAQTLEGYAAIQERLAANCQQYTPRNLFRVQCPECRCIDATDIRGVEAGWVAFHCERCGKDMRQVTGAVRGKLAWKLDCAARWNLYQIDTETFSKTHFADLGTLNISKFVSQEIFGGKIPAIVKYGDLRLSRELSGRLLEALPPRMLKALLTTRLRRDLDLTRDYVENFCRKYTIRPGVSYVDYVRQELPRKALALESELERPRQTSSDGHRESAENELVAFGNRFSAFFYNKRYDVRFPVAEAFDGIEPATLTTARDAIRHALHLRDGGMHDSEALKLQIKNFFADRPSAPGVYPFLRKVFGQTDGPNITSLLAILPRNYLNTVHLVLSALTRTPREDHETVAFDRGEEKAA